MSKGNFYDIEGLQNTCNKVHVKRARLGPQTGKIYSEGCWYMEIINYSIRDILTLTVAKESLILYPGGDIDPAAGTLAIRFDRIILPGHPALVQSNIIEFAWNTSATTFHDIGIIRHMIEEYQEGIEYPVYKARKK